MENIFRADFSSLHINFDFKKMEKTNIWTFVMGSVSHYTTISANTLKFF